ncbi:glutamic acid-rich protein-like [Cynoglossus semilaevis]|uniref:glutamic acid-rich protein-like n=1 Tax=Cynoglossus semilaevis TaxID=244447 RepID=UPI000495B0E0|nr:glutamic acid-rich protein-like [Cynoglossus semilaevis]
MDEDEDGEDLSPDNTEDDSERCKNIQGRVGRTETQTSDSSDEQSSAEEGDDEDKNPGEDSEKDEQHKERCVENIHRVYVRKSSEMEAEDELEGEHGDQRKINSHSQKKEDENKDDKKITSEEESNDEEEEKRSDITKEEESDSDDVIITPQVDRPRTMRNISEAAEVRSYDYEKEESEARSLDKDLTESSEDDIENMLSPQEPTKKL